MSFTILSQHQKTTTANSSVLASVLNSTNRSCNTNFQKLPLITQQTTKESGGPPAIISKKLRHILGVVVYCMIASRKLMLDLQLLLKHEKIAGKAIADTLTFNNRAIALSFYIQRKVESSCNNTPSYPMFHVNKRKNRNRGHWKSNDYENSLVVGDDFETLYVLGFAFFSIRDDGPRRSNQVGEDDGFERRKEANQGMLINCIVD